VAENFSGNRVSLVNLTPKYTGLRRDLEHYLGALQHRPRPPRRGTKGLTPPSRRFSVPKLSF